MATYALNIRSIERSLCDSEPIAEMIITVDLAGSGRSCSAQPAFI